VLAPGGEPAAVGDEGARRHVHIERGNAERVKSRRAGSLRRRFRSTSLRRGRLPPTERVGAAGAAPMPADAMTAAAS